MLTKSAAALALGTLAFAPSTKTTVDAFRLQPHPGGIAGSARHSSASGRLLPGDQASMRGHSAAPSSLPYKDGVIPTRPSQRGTSSARSFSAWGYTGSNSQQQEQQCHDVEHHHHHQQQQQQDNRQRHRPSTAGGKSRGRVARVALSAGARPRAEQQDPAARRSVSNHSSHLDDFRYVAAITGGVREYLDAMDGSLSGELVTVVTYMPWCRSCHHLRHHLRMTAQAYAIAESGAMFYEIDLHKNPEVRKMLDVHAAPTVLLYSSGQLVDEFTCAGNAGPKVMLRHIEAQIGAVPDFRHAETASLFPLSPTPGTVTEYKPVRKDADSAREMN